MRLQPLRAINPLGRTYFIHCGGTRKARRRLSGDCCTDASSAVVCTCPLTWCPPISSPTRADLRVDAVNLRLARKDAVETVCYLQACASRWRTLQAILQLNPLSQDANEKSLCNWKAQMLMVLYAQQCRRTFRS